ncbi:helix-turn-helix transcriptional regulator [Pseudonocardia pini]|uniref:helix-turn-helix transcriptional regulator n=1 Tax=Pseudonocardia pini TaxID=2758030 RepID=UPI0028ABFBF6|nr:helix-turn-helix domain-containing protein [Pseudonocardia pini]
MAETRRKLASRTEVAEYLGVPPATLAQWAHQGTGPRYVRVGRHARYRWADVESWLETHEFGPTP